jgi:hypothetical protein
MSQVNPHKPETTEVETARLVELITLASDMASDLHDFGSENADHYRQQLDKWAPKSTDQ